MLYWYEMTGEWIHYSYTGEHFAYWNRPKIAAVLFDSQNGLFPYSPMVLLMVAAIFPAIRVRKYQAFSITVIFVLSTYVFASWWAWWFGGAFGHRSYIELYALLALPFAGMIAAVFRNRFVILRVGFILLLILLMAYSVRMSYLYAHLPGPWDGPEWR